MTTQRREIPNDPPPLRYGAAGEEMRNLFSVLCSSFVVLCVCSLSSHYSTTPLLHHPIAALRSASARSMGVTFRLQLADAFDNIDQPGNEGEDSGNDDDKPQRQKSQLQHHPRDCAHLTNGRDLARPTWFHPHFVADEIMQNGRADQNDCVAGND